ncbi:MAG: TIGR01548 family HAD-type hydrolase [Alphaproteobacteria bacterium]|nr:TIGR01548 family HAD-type hydrolase [Alphaproteobacteria bacterium]
MPLPRPSAAIAGTRPYTVPRHGAPMDLMLDGIGGLPTPPELLTEALATLDPERLVRHYPDTGALRERLAARHGVAVEQVLVTSGGDDALDRACRALLSSGRNLVLPVPTFEMLHRYAQWAGAEVRAVDWPGGAYPVDAVLEAVDADTTAIAVVSPNNPTGQVIRADELRRLAAGAPDAVLLVDLAYVEFADEDLTEAVLALPQALAFRTLSKAWGLAGLRVGYALGPAELVGWLRTAGNPYTVSAASAAVALHRLQGAEDEVQAYVARVRAQRDALGDVLAEVGAQPQRSQANFVFARSARAGWIRDALAGLGIGVRTWPGHPTLGDAVRVNVPGDEAVMQRLTHALRAALAPEALLLDMDGVLADVSGSYRAAILQTAATFGVTVTSADVERAKAEGNANNDWVLTHRLVLQAGGQATLEAVTARFEELYQGTPGQPGLRATETLIPAASTLEALAARLPLAIVTGRPRRDAHAFLEEHGLAHLMRAVVCMEDAPAKPDPAPVALALAQLGVGTAWLVGDTPDDVRAARAAGVVPVGVVAPGADPMRAMGVLTSAGASRVLRHPDALLELLP